MTENIKDTKKKNSFGTFIKRVILIFLIFLIVFPIAIITLAQFEFFRSYALKTILGFINEELIAEIHAEDLRISFSKGLTIYSASLFTDGDTLAFVDEINLKFDIADLLHNKITVNYLKLTNPNIKLLRNSTDSLWNYEKIAYPSITPSDTTPSNLRILIENLVMENARFAMYDSTLAENTGKKVDFNHMSFESLNMQARAEAILDKNIFNFKMKSFSAKEIYSGFQIDDLDFIAEVSPSELSLKNLHFKTGDYRIEGDLKMLNYDVFGIEEPKLDSANFVIDVEAEQIDQRFIEYFSEIPIYMTGKHDIKVELSGDLNNLQLNKVIYDNGESNLNISGSLFNLIHSEDFSYELNLDNSMIQRANLIQLLPELELNSIPQFGIAQFDELYLKGNSDTVFAIMNLKSDAGNVLGRAGLNFVSDLNYSADIQFTKIDMSSILKEASLKSNLNGLAVITGSGTDIESLFIRGDVKLNKSQFMHYDIKDISLNFQSNKNSQFIIDTLIVNLFRSSISNDGFSKFDIFDDSFMQIEASGYLDLIDNLHPKYNIKADFASLNFAKLLNNNIFPTHLTGALEIDGEGFHPDSLMGKYHIELDEILFPDRALMPFGLDLQIIKYQSHNELLMDSDFFDASFSGQYNLGELIDVLSYQGTYLGEFISKKVMSLNPDLQLAQDTSSIFEIEKIASFPHINGKFKAHIKDISPLNAFLEDVNIFTEMDFDLQVNSEDSTLSVFIDSLQIQYLDLHLPDLNINLRDYDISGRLVSNLKDSLPEFEYFEIMTKQNEKSLIGDFSVDNLNTDLRFDGETLDFKILGMANSNMSVKTQGTIKIDYEKLKFKIDSLQFNYSDMFSWNVAEPILIDTYENTIAIHKMILTRGNSERIEISGAKEGDLLKDLIVKVNNFPVQDLLIFSDEELKSQFSSMQFVIDSLSVNISNDVFRPIISTEFYSDSIAINGHYIGTLNGKIKHDQDHFVGKVQLFHEFGKTPIELMNLDIQYLPVYFGLDSLTAESQSQKKSDIVLTTNSFPLEFLSPFVPGLSDIRGRADIDLKLGGILHEKPVYSGKIKSKAIRFRVDAINIEYNAITEIYIDNSRISIIDLHLQNVNYDARFGRIGKAEVLGFIDLDDKFMPKMIDISITADRLLVLNDNTSLTMPDLFGDFIISTDMNPIRFSGTLTEPNLSGDVNVIYAELEMPMLEKRQQVRTNLEYEVIDSVHRIKTITRIDTNDLIETAYQRFGSISERSIADLINYDLRIKILGQFTVLMDMNMLGELFAEIATPDRNTPLLYQKRRDTEEAKLFGEVFVKDNSTLKFIKQFTTSGTIQFPTGSIENPSLNLQASHKGTMLQDGNKRRFEVRMHITGTKELPDIKFKYFVEGIEASGSEEQINENALFLLVMGRTKTGSDASSDLLTESFTSSFTNFATKALTEMLMNTGVIKSAELNFGGNTMNFEQATLKISGQLFGGISWTIGGTIADLSANNEITIDIPASEFLTNPFWTNFVLQITKATTQNTTIVTQDAKNWEVKIKFGNTW